ncbi:MAG: hypothetical protein LBS30_03570, partial [Planctomycetota bacterium]|nr:hypothetical protein [Planctomycetota bacterium]
RHLAEERGSGGADGGAGKAFAATKALAALTRCYRRIGLVGQNNDAMAFSESFIRHVALAVSRPESQIALLLRLFAAGEDAMELRPVCGATPVCQECLLTRECDYFNNPRKPEMAALSPAARIMAGHPSAVSDAELLAVILYGDRATGQEELVTTILARYGRLLAMARGEPREFSGLRDMAKGQALRLAAFNALHRRLLTENRGEMLRIVTAHDFYARYAPELRDMLTEAVVLIMLNQQNHVIRDAWFSQDSPNGITVKIGDFLRPALREYAPRVAVVHNHPGNNTNPSMEDVNFTRSVRDACCLLGLTLVDHVIVAESGYFSFKENGMLGG